jgi:hypothetical protein
VNAPTYQQCYSQTFTLAAGTYHFGDLDYYNLSNFRDVLIVATPTPAPKLRHVRITEKPFRNLRAHSILTKRELSLSLLK